MTPPGTCSVVDPVDQGSVVSTVRLQSSVDDVRLAAVQRVVRAQRFDGTGRFAHFTLFGLVSAGRDSGGLPADQGRFASLYRAP